MNAWSGLAVRVEPGPAVAAALRGGWGANAMSGLGGDATLGQVVADALALVQVDAALRVISIECDLQPAQMALPVADPQRLLALLRRVLDNAVEHNLVGGLVWLKLCDGADGPVLLVADTGAGMPDAQAARVQAALGEGVAVQSAVGAGTRVRIPLAGPVALVASRHDGLLPVEEPEGTVMCVEDHDVDFFLIEEALARWPKVRVLHVSGVHGALEAVAAVRPSVTLLDMRLADGSGLDVLRPLRRNPATADLAVFVLSADAMPHQVSAAFDAGADGYWTKPLDIDSFLSKMEELLRRQRGTTLPIA